MLPIKKLSELYNSISSTKAEFSRLAGVDAATVNNWLNGTCVPNLQHQVRLEQLIDQYSTNSSSHIEEASFKESIDGGLLHLREAFHRRSKLSSRNELLEEACKLIYCQFTLIKSGQDDLCCLDASNSSTVASQLIEKCNNVLKSSFPGALRTELGDAEILLKLKPSENLLAADIIGGLKKIAWPRAAVTEMKIDVLNDVFGKFLSDSFSQEKQLGQYLTPTEVVDFTTDLVLSSLSNEQLDTLTSPERCHEFGLILDPSCGVGSFLTAIVRKLKPLVYASYGTAGLELWLDNLSKNVLVGIDKSERMIKFAFYNLSIAGLPNVNLHSLNSLERPNSSQDLRCSLEGKVGLILTNPPFGAEFTGNDLMQYKLFSGWAKTPPKKIDSELLFIERYYDWLVEGGYCFSIVPDSILTNRKIYLDLRNGLKNQISLHLVVSLPSKTFGAAGTTVKTSIIGFKKGGSQCETFFGIADEIGFDIATKGTQRTKVLREENDLVPLKSAFLRTDTFRNSRWTNFDASSYRWDAIYHSTLDEELVGRIETPLPEDIRLSAVVNIVNDRVDPRKLAGAFDYIEISDIDSFSSRVRSKKVACIDAPSRARKRVRAGDILVSTVRPAQKKIGVVGDKEDGAICTTGLVVLRSKSICPRVIAEMLKSSFVTTQFLRYNIGIAYPVIEEDCLPKIILPIPKRPIPQLENEALKIISLEKDLLLAQTALHNAI